MHVALLNPVFWPEVRRGSERFARELADGLLAQGHEVSLITSVPRLRDTGTTDEQGLNVIRVFRPNAIEHRLRRRLFEEHLAHLPFTFGALTQLDPDVAHALYPTDALAALRWKQRTQRPVVHSYMGIPHRQSLANRRRRKEIVTKVCREADATVALSDIAQQGFRHWLGVDAQVIPPAVDLTTFTPKTYDQRATRPLVLCAADHTQPRKRVGLLKAACDELGVQLAVTRVNGAAAPPGTIELDLDDRAALAQANREAWVHALPSIGEAFGLVLAEALATGTPVVGGQPEVVGDRTTGAYVDQEATVDDVAQALQHALTLSQDPRTIATCRQRAERWSVAACASAYADLYSALR